MLLIKNVKRYMLQLSLCLFLISSFLLKVLIGLQLLSERGAGIEQTPWPRSITLFLALITGSVGLSLR